MMRALSIVIALLMLLFLSGCLHMHAYRVFQYTDSTGQRAVPFPLPTEK
jgi:hypothetical protein